MEKKEIVQQQNKYALLNPYHGGSQALTYTPEQVIDLALRKRFLKAEDKLRIFLTNPFQPN